MKLLKDLFLEELADMYDAERRIVKALPKLAAGATSHKLKEALLAHAKQSEGHVTKLEQVFALFAETPKTKTCEATVGMIKEGEGLAADFKGSPAINAALISAAQRVEHYEMAAYGCLHEWAGLLGHKEAAVLLKSILHEETAANETLKTLARGGSNKEALNHGSDRTPTEERTDRVESLREDRAAALV
jgi:ferritin-like metal-binding protein YciE